MSLLPHPPSIILTEFLTENGFFSAPADNDDWPLFAGHLPELDRDCAVLHDTAGLKDGRLMEGEPIYHHGLQLMLRASSHPSGWSKAQEVDDALRTVAGSTIEVEDITYALRNISSGGPPLDLGLEPGTKRRHLYSLNYLTTIRLTASSSPWTPPEPETPAGVPVVDTFQAEDGQTEFTLSETPHDPTAVIFAVNGQMFTSPSISVVGQTLTWDGPYDLKAVWTLWAYYVPEA